MTTNEDLLATAECLQRIFPTKNLVHLGVGHGTGNMHRWRQWDVGNALLIDAEEQSWIQLELARAAGWSFHNALIGPANTELDYFRATNPNESGLFDPGQLQPLWPNLRVLEIAPKPCKTLDTVLEEASIDWTPDWLVIDCLPAAILVEAAPTALKHCTVVWARSLLGDFPDTYAGSRYCDLETVLTRLGFRCVAVASQNHPNAGEAIFVRDWRASMLAERATLQCQFDDLATTHADLAERYKTLSTAHENAISTSAEHQSQIQSLLEEKTALSDTLAGLTEKLKSLENEKGDLANAAGEKRARETELAELTAVKLSLEERVTELQTVNSELSKARDEQSKLAADRLAQNAALETESATLSTAKQEIEKRLGALESEKAALTKTISDQAERIRKFESEASESVHRQQMLHEEMLKAEAQLDLIKDVLLREPGI